MRHSLPSVVLVASLSATAMADFVGWSATVRTSGSGFLVNVFAVTNSQSDVLVNVFGGTPSRPGSVTTTSPGGFLQAGGAWAVFRPTVSQDWRDADSFLTIGGGFDASTGAWTADAGSLGDPGWRFTGPNGASVDGFSVASDASSGLLNPWTSELPTSAGWYLGGSGAVARSLASLSPVRLGHTAHGGQHFGASSGAAASGQWGMLVAQLHVADLDGSFIRWNMGATIRRGNGTAHQGQFDFTVAPAPGAVAVLLMVGSLGRRRPR